jgi:ribosomal protein S18 acetylase RimI-like enzyme
MDHVLDNPAWSALNTVHAEFALGDDAARRYRKGVLPFAALAPGAVAADLGSHIETGESFYLIGELPELPPDWVLELELPCAQLLAPEDLRMLPATTESLPALGVEYRDEMYRLVMRVQPGYYLPDTPELGHYFGIFDDGRLAAMAGERMRMTGYSEISAVCTLPQYQGRGFAQQLMTRVCEVQAAEGVQPFLHVSRANTRALRLYEHLGFRHRRDISFYRLKKIGS